MKRTKSLSKHTLRRPSDLPSNHTRSITHFLDGVSVDSPSGKAEELHTPSTDKLLNRLSAAGTEDWAQHTTAASSRRGKSGGQVDALFRHKVQAIVNPLYFLLKDQPKLQEGEQLLERRGQSPEALSPELQPSVSQSSIQGGGQAPIDMMGDADVFCKQKVHERNPGGGKHAATHLCVEKHVLICARCAQKHTARGHNTLSLTVVVNKTRAVLGLLQDQTDRLLEENSRNMETCRFRQAQMQRARAKFDEKLD